MLGKLGMSGHKEQRRFGRRRSLIHGLVITTKGHRIPCLVRNISVGGALLEVATPLLVSRQLTLLIDSDGFEADCEIRHRTQSAIGVCFQDVRVAASGRDTRLAGPRLQQAMQDVTISNLGRG